MVSGFAHASEFHVLFIWCVFACTLSANFQHCLERQFIVQAVFSTPSFPLSTVHLAWWVPVSFSCVGACGWVPGFASYRSSLHLEAGCQQRKLLDVSGTQPLISDAVVNRSCFVQVRRSRLILWDLGGTFSMTSARFVSARESAEPNFNWGKKGGGEGVWAWKWETGLRVWMVGSVWNRDLSFSFSFILHMHLRVKQNKMSSSWKVACRNIIILGFFCKLFLETMI